MPLSAGDAGAEADAELAVFAGKADGRELLADLINDAQGLLATAVRQHRHKFLAAIAAQAVDTAQALAQQVGQGADDVVANGVAMAVVDLLEVIDIQHHHAGRLAIALGAFLFDDHLLLDIGVLEQPGQAVARKGSAEQAGALGTGEHRGDQAVVGNRLGNEVVAGLDQGAHLPGDIGFRREVDDRHAQPVVIEAHHLRQLGAGAVGHIDVQQQHFRVETAHGLEQLLWIVDHLHQHIGAAQHQAVATGQIAVVVDDQHPVGLAILLGKAALQAAFQLGHVHRLAEKAHGPDTGGLQLSMKVVLGGDHQQRQRLFQALLQGFGVVQASLLTVAQVDVDDQGVGQLFGQRGIQFGGGEKVAGLVAEGVEGQANGFADLGLVFEDIDTVGAFTARRLAQPAAGRCHRVGCGRLLMATGELLQFLDKGLQALLLQLQAAQPLLGLQFQLAGALAQLGKPEGAGAAGQLVQLLAQLTEVLQLFAGIGG